ncbi:MAG: MFS transporter, partial [Nitriliruptoraceae bacterium]
TGPGQTIGVSVFIDPMIAGLELTRSQVATAYLIGTLAGAFMQPIFGRLFDRRGSRRATAIIGVAFGVVLVGMAGVAGLVTLTLGFFGIRALGQGGLSVIAGTTPALWFDRRRGVAIAASTAMGSAGNSLVPLATAAVIAAVGWRATWIVFALVVWVIVLSIARWGLIDRPADVGQHMDGMSPHRGVAPSVPAGRQNDPGTPADDGASQAAAAESLEVDPAEVTDARLGLTRAEAMRTPIFWAVTSAIATAALVTTALTFHQISILGEQGLGTFEAATNFVPQTFSALIATLVVGALIDKIRQRFLLAAMLVLIAGAMVGVSFVQPGILAVIYGIVLGAGQGTMRAIGGASYAKLFGIRAAGEIRGVAKVLSSSSSSFGPLVLAFGFELTGSYQQILILLLVLPVASLVFALLAPEVRKPPETMLPTR